MQVKELTNDLRGARCRARCGYRVREAKRLRDQDIVDDENRRQERWNSYLAREAEIQADASPSLWSGNQRLWIRAHQDLLVSEV